MGVCAVNTHAVKHCLHAGRELNLSAIPHVSTKRNRRDRFISNLPAACTGKSRWLDVCCVMGTCGADTVPRDWDGGDVPADWRSHRAGAASMSGPRYSRVVQYNVGLLLGRDIG